MLHASVSSNLQIVLQPKVLRSIDYEIDIMRSLNHPNIIRPLGVAWSSTPCLILPLYSSSLWDYISNNGPISEQSCLDLASKMLSALHQCHSRGIIHRDIKPHNILLDASLQPVLADFGSSIDITSTVPTPGSLCTEQFCSPLLSQTDVANEDSDLYALGCTLLFLHDWHIAMAWKRKLCCFPFIE
eukprot:UN01933